MPANTTTKENFFRRHRSLVLLLSIALFLPPLSLFFQFTQDSNFCGTWCPRMFFVWRKGMFIGDFFMGFLRSYMGVALVVGVLSATFFLGRYWCSHLCPIGASTETVSRVIPKALKLDFSRVPAPSFRYGYLAVFLLSSALGVGSLCCNYCNFATIPRLFGAAFSQADAAYFLRSAGMINLGLMVALGFVAKGGRAYCNLLCPIGALDALSNKIGAKFGRRMRVNAGKCTGCGACSKVCPTWALQVKDRASIDDLSCIPCGKCEKICPQEAITYGKTDS